MTEPDWGSKIETLDSRLDENTLAVKLLAQAITNLDQSVKTFIPREVYERDYAGLRKDLDALAFWIKLVGITIVTSFVAGLTALLYRGG